MSMVPENESAFAVYTGAVSSKGHNKKKKAKDKKNAGLLLDKMDKLDIMKKKKEKKNKILKRNGIESLEDSFGKIHKKKSKFPSVNVNVTEEKIKKKKKKKIKSPVANGSIRKPTDITLESDLSSQSQILSETVVSIAPDVPLTVNTTYCVIDKTEKNKKKVQIISNLPVRKNEEFKKVVASTPRFKRKLIEPKKAIVSSKSNILTATESYTKKKRTNEVDVSESSASSSSILQKLAGEAKIIADKKGSKEAVGEVTLQKILEPFSVKSFLRDYWEKKPLHIPGKGKKFSSFISTEMIDSVLRDNIVQFGKHLDVTSYTDGERETHNPEGRAHAHIVWDYYSNGCSVRLLNPQYFMNTIHILTAHLQEFFGCFVGANVYLTPPDSQGFAPHFDDIEAIILQVEGTKIWNVYAPLDKDGYLPRFSSRNLSEEEIGEPIMEVTLKAGDVLYFPRGFIHQARADNQHSLHITLSTYQQTSWCDYLEKLLPLTLKNACRNDVEFRKGMPIGYLETAGLAYKSSPNQKRKLIVDRLKDLMRRLTDYLEVDSAMDELGLKYIQEALPPVLSPKEAACSIIGDGWRMGKNGKLTHQIEFNPDTRIRWIRNYCFRILEENATLEDGSIEKQTRIYYTLENSREYRKEEPQFIIIPPNMVAGVLHLVSVYPEYIKLSDIPLEHDDKVILVGDLWDRGLLMTDEPLTSTTGNELTESPLDAALSKEEEEVMADLLEAVSHGNDEDQSNDSDEESDTMASDTLQTLQESVNLEEG